MNLNDFYFTGQVASTPETKAFTGNSKTSFLLEQTTTYREVEKKTVITVNSWHKGESHTQKLKVGDRVLVKGRFSSNPYKERHITNMDAIHVVLLSAPQTSLPELADETIPF